MLYSRDPPPFGAPGSALGVNTLLGGDNMESVVAECRYEGGRLIEVRLHPTDLGDDAPLSEKGIPRAASPRGNIPERELS